MSVVEKTTTRVYGPLKAFLRLIFLRWQLPFSHCISFLQHANFTDDWMFHFADVELCRSIIDRL